MTAYLPYVLLLCASFLLTWNLSRRRPRGAHLAAPVTNSADLTSTRGLPDPLFPLEPACLFLLGFTYLLLMQVSGLGGWGALTLIPALALLWFHTKTLNSLRSQPGLGLLAWVSLTVLAGGLLSTRTTPALLPVWSAVILIVGLAAGAASGIWTGRRLPHQDSSTPEQLGGPDGDRAALTAGPAAPCTTTSGQTPATLTPTSPGLPRRSQEELPGDTPTPQTASTRTTPSDAVLDSLDEALLVIDAGGAIRYCNGRVTELLGEHGRGATTLSQLLAPLKLRDESGALLPGTSAHVQARLDAATQGAPAVLEVKRPDGHHLWLHARAHPIERPGALSRVLYVLQDVTEQHQLNEELLRTRRYSPITGLPNRHHFHELLASLPAQDARTVIIVQCLSITDLRVVQGQLASRLSRIFAEALDAAYPEALVRGQLDDHTFALVLPARETRLRADILAPVVIDTDVVYPRVRACACLGPWPSGELPGAVQAAEFSVRLAPEGTLLPLEERFVTERRRRVQLEHALRRALDREELQVHYQPIVRLGTGQLVKAEALVRWEDAEIGCIPPSQFVPLAEELGQVHVLTDLVIRRALAEARRASHLLDRDVRIAVNLAPCEMNAENFMERMASLVADHPDAPRRLAFEVTESCALSNLERTAQHLRTLRNWGFGLALDDFGTGYSALSVLQHLPIHHLKLDRSFLWGIEDNNRLQVLTGSVMELASRLNIEVVAESIETPGHEAILRELGCPLGQGFLYSRPEPFPNWAVYQ